MKEDIALEALETLNNWGAWQRAGENPFALLNYSKQPVVRLMVEGYRETTRVVESYDPDEAEQTERLICSIPVQRYREYLVYHFVAQLSVRKIVEVELNFTGVGRNKASNFLTDAIKWYTGKYDSIVNPVEDINFKRYASRA